MCFYVLCHPADHGTNSMGIRLLTWAHIANMDKLIELEVTELTSSMVDETASAILNRHVCCGISIVSFQLNFIFDILVSWILTEFGHNLLKLAATECVILEFHQDSWNHYLMSGHFSPHIRLDTISHFVVQQSSKALGGELVLPSVTSLSKIRQRESSLRVYDIMNQLQSIIVGSLAFDGWKSRYKFASIMVIV